MILLHDADAAIADQIDRLLAVVERRFAEELQSDLPEVNELTSHIEHYRGKMLRPMLVLLSGMACGKTIEPRLDDAHVTLAAVVEMVHMATLVHDDVLDDAALRRKGPTINALAGNEAAVMLGDYLISHSYHLCSSLGQESISRQIASTTNTICEGELLQLANRRKWTLDETSYFQIIDRKTASLIATCCRLGAELAGASEQQAEAMARYGSDVGQAFQIIDDVLDLKGDEQTVGKTLGLDLEKGKLTLPIIHSLTNAGDDRRREIFGLLDAYAGDHPHRNGSRPPLLRALTQSVDASESVTYAQQVASVKIESAKATMQKALPDTPAKALMLAMADAVIRREA